MQKVIKSIGTVKTSTDNNIYKLSVEVDPQISEYYLWFLRKEYNIQRQRYAPHITVIREKSFVDFKNYNNKEIEFEYSGEIFVDNLYAWLNVKCDYLYELRKDLGLKDYDWYTKPPDGNDGFHITIGNFKHLVKK